MRAREKETVDDSRQIPRDYSQQAVRQEAAFGDPAPSAAKMLEKVRMPAEKDRSISRNFCGSVATSGFAIMAITTAINSPSTMASMAAASAETTAIKTAFMEMPRMAGNSL
jgi:hypothetical protein